MLAYPNPAQIGRPPQHALIVTFDITRAGNPTPSLAVGSLLAYARTRPEYGHEFILDHHSVLLDGLVRRDPEEVTREVAERVEVSALDVVAIAAYAWSESVVDSVMAALRRHGFRGPFVVGGYQVTREVDLDSLYPDARYLIEGPADAELVRIFCEPPAERVLVGEVTSRELVSPYLTGVIEVPAGAAMVRMETQRGCRWRCKFCSYRGLGEGPVQPLPLGRVAAELRLFSDRKVRKINILDPEFNARRGCLDVLRAMVDLGLQALVTVQARPENLVKAPFGREFLDLCGELNIHLEFGLQTAIPAESEAIRRANDLTAVSRALEEVSRRGISHEVSLIYGLPLQTVASFRESLEFVRRHGVPTVRCFPLMLHRGTALSQEREAWALREEILDAFNIPFVTSSSSFTRNEWLELRSMAEEASADGGNRVSPALPRGAA